MWSLVMEASQQSDPAQVQDALKQLCEIYRRPIVEWLLRRGYGQNSEDLANDFVVFLLEKNRLENFARGTARFRSFLIKCLKRFLRDQWRKGNAGSRGGGVPLVSLDEFEIEIGESHQADEQIDQAFALAVHVRVMSRLEQRFLASGQTARFQELRRFALGNESDISYAEVASRLSMNPNSVKKAVFDLRERYCDFFREEVAQTVSREHIDEEMRYLLTLLARTDTVLAP